MKLRYSPTSPYVRKVAVTIHELGLDDKVERVMTAPWDAATDLGRTNPLGKVPALIADDGTVLYDSPVICEYLDSLVGSRLVPPGGPDRWTALRRQALADGLIDAAVSCVLEGRRPAERRSTEWVTRQRAARPLDRREWRRGDDASARPRSRRRPVAAGRGAPGRLAGGAKPRRLDPGRLHCRSRLRIRRLRAGAGGLDAG